MRRALLAITGLAASTTALVVFKAAPGTGQPAQEAPTAAEGPAPAAGSDETTPRVSTAPESTRSASGASRSGSSGAPGTPAASRTGTAAAPPTASTLVGPVVSNEFGDVQVRITVVDDRIVNAAAQRLPRGTAQSDRRSDQVDSRYSGAVGMVVERQSADLDTISGATATSDAYRRSLQAAIDQRR
ncbi:FMN-binding protein [Verrucosispora sp. WMMD1129]|uniref:FMN-binding protein n=1 Tax=Verrucosispora sp. WMMD1129 TaxID=3016093 RepID=UPI00249B91AC|nr:FMN-binding protein [Verrucosispora sp. WMMD1129]WFE47104.1 FMN-binding protein [Verrucosispora sp. WMMD1129]